MVIIDKTIDENNNIVPSIVIICIGTEENEVTFVIAYFINDFVDHLVSPSVLSLY